MRAYELIKETLLRRAYIGVIHLAWLALYGFYGWLFLPDTNQLGGFLFTWGGFLLPLALSTGILGDDMASGRICVLITKPFWWGELYLCRLIGLSLQGAIHLLLAGGLLSILVRDTHLHELALWLFAAWLLFNTIAALSTTFSVIIERSLNSILLLALIFAGFVTVHLVLNTHPGERGTWSLHSFIRYVCPPFELLRKFAEGERGPFSLYFGRFHTTWNVASIVHSCVLTVAYSLVGIFLLCRREFSRVLD